MNLLPIYLKALDENLTAKQAGAKFGVRHDSLAKCKNRYGLQSLRNEWDCSLETQLDKMNDTQIISYWNALGLSKNSKCFREKKICKLIINRRKIVIHDVATSLT